MQSTNFTTDKKELEQDLKYGQNKRSSEHIGMYMINHLIKKSQKIFKS